MFSSITDEDVSCMYNFNFSSHMILGVLVELTDKLNKISLHQSKFKQIRTLFSEIALPKYVKVMVAVSSF